MKKVMALTLMVFVVIAQAQAADKTFTESGEIVDGEEWWEVYIYNDDTIVGMSGGVADFIHVFDSSTLNVTGGSAQMRTHDTYNTPGFSDQWLRWFRCGMMVSERRPYGTAKALPKSVQSTCGNRSYRRTQDGQSNIG